MIVRNNRRQMLQAMACGMVAVGAGGAGLGGVAWAATPARTNWKGGFVEVAKGVFAQLASPHSNRPIEAFANAGLVLGLRQPLMVDTTGEAKAGQQLFRRALTAASGAVPGHVVLTSQHNGFVAGLPLAGDAEIIAHANARAAMKSMGSTLRPVLPDCTIDQELTMRRGDGAVRVFAPMRGPAATELAVHVQDAGVLFTGDLAGFGVVPDLRTARYGQLLKVVDDFIALKPQVVVPGYGPPGGVAELQTYKAFLETLMAKGKEAKAAGLSAGEAAARIDLGVYEAMWGMDTMRIPALVRLFHELDGTAKPFPDLAGERAAMAEYLKIKGAAK